MKQNSSNTAPRPKLELKIRSLESKVTPHCTEDRRIPCENAGFTWYKGECLTGQLAAVADY